MNRFKMWISRQSLPKVASVALWGLTVAAISGSAIALQHRELMSDLKTVQANVADEAKAYRNHLPTQTKAQPQFAKLARYKAFVGNTPNLDSLIGGFTVKAVFPGPKPVAVVASGKNQKTYRVGDVLQRGLVVAAIDQTGITVSKGRQKSKLNLPLKIPTATELAYEAQPHLQKAAIKDKPTLASRS